MGAVYDHISDRISEHISGRISFATGRWFRATEHQPIGGGCINRAVVLKGERSEFFVKLNHIEREDMFAAEADGISAIEKSESLRVPHPVCWGSHGDTAYLVLEYIHLSRADASTMQAMGAGLAALHHTSADRFGWHRDNTIGSTAQPNAYSDAWVEFLRDRRLHHQLKLAAVNKLPLSTISAGEKLLSGLDGFFKTYQPVPSLLHGDLWSGNFAADSSGNPVVFDPAVYFGDRETDLAMTELFGGFSREFYASYRSAWSLDQGYGVRKTLYNLYHVLNHFNLFGGGYGAQAEDMICRLLAELG